MIKVYQVST